MNEKKPVDVGNVWWFWFTTNAFAVDKRLRRIMRVLPHDPRCKFCNTPFQGIGGMIARVLFNKQRSALNPRYCNMCEIASSVSRRLRPRGSMERIWKCVAWS